MTSNGALPQTLRSITATKISELSKQRALFDQRKAEIANAAASAPNLRAKAQVLLEGVTKLKGHASDALDKEDLDAQDLPVDVSYVENGSERASHINIRRFLLQGQYDPSVSEWALKDWVAQLEQEVRHLQVKHEHASFYSGLVTEWLANMDGEAESEESNANSGRAGMHEQRATWEGYVFTQGNVSVDGIRSYLDSLFMKTSLSQQALEDLRKSIKSFGEGLSGRKEWFSVSDLKWVTRALLKSDLLTKEKTAILKEFMRNSAVTQEVVDVLNMRLASLDSWGWVKGEAVPLEMRRQLNGKYRVFMDEDLLDSIMFQYLGLQWAVAFRGAFDNFLNSLAWEPLREHIPKQVREERRYYCFDNPIDKLDLNVNRHRETTYKEEYFMTQLPKSVDGDLPSYDDDDSDQGVPDEKRKNALETKHSLLHLLITESIIHSTLHGQFTATRSDFKYFGPSLPHDTILTVLSYFDVPEKWLRFFKTFLEMPMKFVQDGPNAPTRVRQRGVPMSHALSDCFGEVVLFCMDYAVNQKTTGAFLYRLHDDFWFWGHEETCVQAWNAMSEFASTVGLEFNEEKTGVVHFTKENARQGSSSQQGTDGALPSGDIRWGFLKLDAEQGRFVIDQEQVDNHILELQRQLSSCKSIFAWIQAWNSYFARFFPNNFAKPAMCFGRDHIDMAISTLSRIERTLFGPITGPGSGVTDYLRKVISDRFGIHDLPEGLFYFPIELGGLELINPYIPLLAMRENIKQTPHRCLQKAFVQDEANYHKAKERFETGGTYATTYTYTPIFSRNRRATDGKDTSSDDDRRPSSSPSTFPSLEEYKLYPESFSRPLLNAYKDLIRIPEEASISQSPNLRGTQSSLQSDMKLDEGAKKISGEWRDMSPYWRWTAELYHGEIVAKYGSLAAVNREFMPLGVVKTLKEGRMRWEN